MLTSLDRATRWVGRRVTTPSGFHLAVAGYFLLLFFIRIYAFPGSSVDDGETLYFGQGFAWGYVYDQPPLFNWLVLLSQAVFGPSIAAGTAVKLAALFATYVFLFHAGRLALEDDRLAALAALSLVTIFQIAWESVMNYSHTPLLAATVAATTYAFLNLERSPHLAAYAGFGLAVGAGIISKFNYVLFLVPLLAAGLMDPVLRPRLLTLRSLMAIGIAAAITAPHVAWKLAYRAGLAGEWVPGAQDGSVLQGLASAAWSAFSFLGPFLVLLLAVFPQAFRSATPEDGDTPARQRRRRLFERWIVLLVLLIVASVIVFDMTKVRTHWMMVLIPLPIYAFLRVQAAGMTDRRIYRFGGILAIVAIVIVVAIGPRWLMGPWTCRKCTFFIPYAELVEQLKQAGFSGGTVIAADYPVPIGPNLRRFFPDSRVLSSRYSPGVYLPTSRGNTSDCLLIWNASREDSEQVALALARTALALEVPQAAERGIAEAPIPRAGDRLARFGYIIRPGECG